MKKLIVFLVIFFFTVSPIYANQQIFSGTQMPESLSWFTQITGSNITYRDIISPGNYNIELGTGTSVLHRYYLPTDYGDNVSAEFRLRVYDTSTASRVILVGNTTNACKLTIQPAQVVLGYLTDGDITYVTDTTSKYSLFSIVIDENNLCSGYVNGVLVGSDYSNVTVNLEQIYFSSGPSTKTDWNTVHLKDNNNFYPEPLLPIIQYIQGDGIFIFRYLIIIITATAIFSIFYMGAKLGSSLFRR